MKTFLSLSAIFMLGVFLTFGVGCFYNYFYPYKYQTEIIEACEENGLSPALVASIINVESGYKAESVSQKGAVGLMQLMPETAKWLCEMQNIEYENIDLTEEKTNIMLGTRYLSMLFNSFSDKDTAICAYNAGPTKVKGWLKQEENSEDGISLSKIPYKETSEYLNKVKKNLKVYSKRYRN